MQKLKNYGIIKQKNQFFIVNTEETLEQLLIEGTNESSAGNSNIEVLKFYK